jgi:hypothetical protein
MLKGKDYNISMKSALSEIWEEYSPIPLLIIFLPSLIVVGLYSIISYLFGHKSEEVDPMQKHKTNPWTVIFSLVVWLFVIGSIINSYRYNSILYTFACPVDNSVKCYELVTESDPEVGYTRIYFPNGGYIDFEYCDNAVNKVARCYAENKEDGSWNITFSKHVRVLK